MSGPPGPDDTEHDWPRRDLDRAPDSQSGSRGADESAWDDWSRPSQPPGPSTEPISTWDDWPPPPEQEPAGELEPEPPISDPWAERWDVEPPPYEPPPPPYEPPPPPYEPSAPWEAEAEPVPAPEAAPMPEAEAEPMLEPEPAPKPAPEPYQPEAQRWTPIWPTQPEEGPAAEEEPAAEAEVAAEEPPAAEGEPEAVEAPVTEEELEALEAPLVDEEPVAAGAASAAELPTAELMPATEGAFGAEAGAEAEAEAPAEDEAAAEPEPMPAPEELEALEAPEEPDSGLEPEAPGQQVQEELEEEPELEAQPPLAPEPDWRAEAPMAAETWQAMPQVPEPPDAQAEATAEVPEPEATAGKGEDGIGAPAEEGDGAAGLLEPSGGEVETAPTDAWAGIERRKPTTAESAVPWLVGIILLLAGMVVVLMALIFSGDQSLGGVIGAASSGRPSAEPTPSPTPQPTNTPQPTPTPEPTPLPIVFGPLEMVYQGRAAALEPIYLLRHDFTTTLDPMVLAQDPALDVGRFDWAPDGSVGAALLGDFLVAIDPDLGKRTLATAISALAFSDSPSTVYAVRVSAAGANDTATVLAIDFGSGTTLELAAVTYVRPEIVAETPLKDAQFIDEGGGIRLYWMEGGTMRLWVLGAGAWQVDPVSGATSEVVGEPLPTLWSPDGSKRIVVAESDTASTLVLYRSGGTEVARTTVDGLVSHLRWAADGSQVNFTLARGSVRQDLFLWSLSSDTPPIQQTDTGAAFGAEWLGAKPLWKP